MLGQLFGSQISNMISTTLTFFLLIEPVTLLLGISPKKTKTCVAICDLHTRMTVLALFREVKTIGNDPNTHQ